MLIFLVVCKIKYLDKRAGGKYMNAELKHRLNYEILMLERTRKEYVSRLERLENYKGSFLRCKNHGHGKYYYFIKRHGAKAYKYIGDSDKREVKMVREARFLEEAIRRIDRDLGLMKSLADDFLPFDPSHISESLPKTYRCDVPPVSDLYQREGAEWKAAQLDYQKIDDMARYQMMGKLMGQLSNGQQIPPYLLMPMFDEIVETATRPAYRKEMTEMRMKIAPILINIEENWEAIEGRPDAVEKTPTETPEEP